jgi:hypothetical protein
MLEEAVEVADETEKEIRALCGAATLKNIQRSAATRAVKISALAITCLSLDEGMRNLSTTNKHRCQPGCISSEATSR